MPGAPPFGATHHFPRWGKSALHLPLVAYVMNNISVISRLRRPFPLWCLRHHLSPAVRGHNKAPYSIPLISGAKVSTGCCPTACGGKVVAPATNGGCFSNARKGGCTVFLSSIERKPGCKGFLKTGTAGAHHNPHGLKGRVKPENPQAAGLSNLGPKGRQPSL